LRSIILAFHHINNTHCARQFCTRLSVVRSSAEWTRHCIRCTLRCGTEGGSGSWLCLWKLRTFSREVSRLPTLVATIFIWAVIGHMTHFAAGITRTWRSWHSCSAFVTEGGKNVIAGFVLVFYTRVLILYYVVFRLFGL
jgi:hypothetical protein